MKLKLFYVIYRNVTTYIKKSVILKFILTAIFLLIFSGCATILTVKKSTVYAEDLPEESEEIRIVFISDLHISRLLPESYFTETVKKVLALKPDILLLGGDYIDGHTEDFDSALEKLAPLADLNNAAVLGNHDNFVSPYDVRGKLESLGFTVLDNSTAEFQIGGQKLTVAGLADYYTDFPEIQLALNDVKNEEFCILLSHSPEIYSIVRNDMRVDLMLSGHSHGGQITFFGLYAPVLPLQNHEYWRGSYSSDINRLIVSNGIGVSGMPVRFFADPHIELIRLKKYRK